MSQPEQGIKHDGGKPQWDLLPWDAVEQVVRVLDFGSQKYSGRNWEKGIVYSRVFSAAIRHLWTWFHAKARGEDGTDPETGHSHLAHAACCILFLLAFETRGMAAFDDRPAPPTAD